MGQGCGASGLGQKKQTHSQTPSVFSCPHSGALFPSGRGSSSPGWHLPVPGGCPFASLSAHGPPALALVPRGLPPHSALPHESLGILGRQPRWETEPQPRSRVWSQELRAPKVSAGLTVLPTQARVGTSGISLQQNCTARRLSVTTFSRLFCLQSLPTLHNKHNHGFLKPRKAACLTGGQK